MSTLIAENSIQAVALAGTAARYLSVKSSKGHCKESSLGQLKKKRKFRFAA